MLRVGQKEHQMTQCLQENYLHPSFLAAYQVLLDTEQKGFYRAESSLHTRQSQAI